MKFEDIIVNIYINKGSFLYLFHLQNYSNELVLKDLEFNQSIISPSRSINLIRAQSTNDNNLTLISPYQAEKIEIARQLDDYNLAKWLMKPIGPSLGHYRIVYTPCTEMVQKLAKVMQYQVSFLNWLPHMPIVMVCKDHMEARNTHQGWSHQHSKSASPFPLI